MSRNYKFHNPHDDGYKFSLHQMHEYEYDPNGNMHWDLHRELKVDYGLLHNMPIYLQHDDGILTNHYTRDGRKLGKKLYNSQHSLLYDERYYDELLIKDGAPSRIQHDEGYILLHSHSDPVFYYYLNDHLGNVRSVIIENNNQPIVTQTNDYYPFGMVYQPQAMQEPEHRNKHLYNSKEEQEIPGKWLDYGARFYDAQIGRWHGVDPLAEDYYPTSPYGYVANNPINAIDPDGREIWIITGRDSRGNAQQVQYREGNLYNEDGSDYKGDNDFALGLQSIFNALYALGDDFVNEVLSTVEDSDKAHHFELADRNGVIPANPSSANKGERTSTQVLLTNRDGTIENNLEATKESSLAHELKHTYDYDKGNMKGEVFLKPDHESPKENRAVKFENIIRKRTGLPKRTTYAGKEMDLDD